MFERITSRVLWLTSITDQPITVGELLSIVAAVVGWLVAITAMWHAMGIVIRAWFQ